MNIWLYVIVGILFSFFVVDIDDYLPLLQNLLTVIFTTLVSIFLLRFTILHYSIHSTSPDKVKLYLLIALSLIILINPFFQIIRKLRRKLAERINMTPPGLPDNSKYRSQIFLLGFLTMRILGDLIPSLQKNGLYVILMVSLMFAYFIDLICTPISSRKKIKN
jgi:hypothetical protein